MLQSRLNAARLKLTGLRESLRSTRAEAATSTVNVNLTTEKIEAVPVGGGRLDGIRDVLAWEAVALLYALVVVGPFASSGSSSGSSCACCGAAKPRPARAELALDVHRELGPHGRALARLARDT